MITKAEYIEQYKLKIFFRDSTIKSINLYNFLKKSTHPLIKKYLNISKFQNFKIDCGTICWGDNDFDINPMNIYKGVYDS